MAPDKIIPFPVVGKDLHGGDPDNITGKYILVDRVPVECPDLLKWGRWMEEGDRHVAETMVEGVRVSTVFLGLDHSYSFGNKDVTPILFETMIFGGEHNQDYQERCCTWAEAEEMHVRAVEAAEKGKKAPTYEWAKRMERKFLRKFFKRK